MSPPAGTRCPTWWGPFAIWKGGLGVWGGIALGVLAGYVIARRAGANTALLADCLAPGLLVAQGIGRFGNWWNQELFGRPTDLPWGLEIDPENRPIAYLDQETFHPTFLYEALWNFAAAGALLLVERRFRIRPPGLFALYVSIYCFGRFWVELPGGHLARDRGPAPQRLGGGDRVRARAPRLRSHPAPRCASAAHARAGQGAPTMAVPKSRVRPGS